jgi:hypothetical protein
MWMERCFGNVVSERRGQAHSLADAHEEVAGCFVPRIAIQKYNLMITEET